jgi:uncharacterized membrane protein
MPIPSSDQPAVDIDRLLEESQETGIRLRDVRQQAAPLLTALLSFGFALYLLVELQKIATEQAPGNLVTLGEYGLAVAVMAYTGGMLLDNGLCRIADWHQCRDCKRDAARWRSGEQQQESGRLQSHREGWR